jgi:hypothetical protein
MFISFTTKYSYIIFLFTISLLISILTYDYYGFAVDEYFQYKIGHTSYNYIFLEKKDLLSLKDSDYGVAFELLLVFVEKILGLEDIRDVHLLRHISSHIFFLISGIFLYLLIYQIYENKILSSFGFLLLILNPSIYSHSFFNTKDIPFMSMFIICFYFGYKMSKDKNIANSIILGITSGLLMNIRIMGALFFVISLGLILYELLRLKKNIKDYNILLIYFITTLLTLYITWPYLWGNPINNFIIAFSNMAHFRFDKYILFNGEFIKPSNLRWDYIPIWFSITTPILYLITGIIGIFLIVFKFISKPKDIIIDLKLRANLTYILYFILPILVVILLKSVLYNSWRQLYFIYPAFIMLIIYTLNEIFKTKFKKSSIVIFSFFFIMILSEMIINFPNQNIYFNELVNKKTPNYLRDTFEMDYWGTSYKQSLEYILKNDPDEIITIAVSNFQGLLNVMFLKESDRKRFNVLELGSENISEAKYFITNHNDKKDSTKNLKPWYSVIVYRNEINSVFKLK